MAFLSGHNLVPDIVAILGVLVFGTGMNVLWLSRREIFAWIEEYFRLLRANVRQVAQPSNVAAEPRPRPMERKHAVRIAVGVVLAFFVAPMLITLGLAF